LLRGPIARQALPELHDTALNWGGEGHGISRPAGHLGSATCAVVIVVHVVPFHCAAKTGSGYSPSPAMTQLAALGHETEYGTA
jgi:hypothetical protein